MRYFSIGFFSLIFIFSIDHNFNRIFNDSYDEAINFIQLNNDLLINELGQDDSIRNEKIAIVFPEILKFSIYKDIIETKALELIYVNYGKEQADFSIGYFQMKPSFIEKIELEIMNNDYLQREYYYLIEFNVEDEKSKRKERINRLSTIEWQLKYLNCFYDIVSIKYDRIDWKNNEEKLRFFATAYNYSFSADKNEIEKKIYLKIFPYGISKGTDQYAYSDIAVYYYKKVLKN